MAETSPPNLCIIGLFHTTSLAFLLYHIYKFDRFKCLVPTRKDWFKALLTWMLVISNACLIIWAMGWAYVKYSLGWVRLGPMGARPWPSALFPPEYTGFAGTLTVLLAVSYSLQAALNAEEGLFFYHLMRAVRQPQAAKPFLKSRFFIAWMIISVAVLAIQLSAPWMAYNGNLQIQLSTELLTGGALELIVLCASSLIVLKFPRFLRDIKAAGAGPEVRARLYYYHELNKLRTLFRFTFTIPLIILGADGITPAATINMEALAADMLIVVMVGSLCAVMMISITLYLPRSAPSASQAKVMVGGMPDHMNQVATGLDIITLLRDGAQWEGVDDDLADQTGLRNRRSSQDAPFATAEAKRASWAASAEEEGHSRYSGPVPGAPVPTFLETFSSPFAVSTEAQPQRPVEIRIHVEREVHKD